jgi:DNA-binding GntR family transcriptional regulator
MSSEKQEKPYQRGVAASEIHDILRDEILTLTLEPGTPLDEVSLSKRFAVSRSPIREALYRLTASRLAQRLPNRSTIVAPVDLNFFPEFIQALDVQQRLATRLAAQNRTEEDIPRLRELADAFNLYVDEASALKIMQANFAFHVGVAEAGRNPYVTRQYRVLLSEARRLLHIHVRFLDAANRKHVMRDQHHDFVDAIEAQDVEAADAIAHAHSMQFHDRFLAALRHVPDDSFKIGTPPATDPAQES